MPTFEFRNPPDMSKLNPLLSDLHFNKDTNSTTQKSSPPIYPKELTDKSLILTNLMQQLEDEKNVNVEVESILARSGPENLTYKKRVGFLEDRIFSWLECLFNLICFKLENRDRLLGLFRGQITKSFMKKLALLKDSPKKEDTYLYPFLNVMDKSVYVEILLQVMFMWRINL